MPKYSSTFSILIIKLLWLYRDALVEKNVVKTLTTLLPKLILHSDIACFSISWLFYGGHRVINIDQIGYHVISGCKEMHSFAHTPPPPWTLDIVSGYNHKTMQAPPPPTPIPLTPPNTHQMSIPNKPPNTHH